MSHTNAYRLDEATELYCLHQFNDSKKHFIKLLPMAKLVWEDIFLNTLWNSEGKRLPLNAGSPYPFIDKPECYSRILGVYTTDDCNQMVPLPINNRINVMPKMARKSCGCKADCDCGDLCASVSGMSVQTVDVVIDGVTYTERDWIQACANGDVIKWREIPTKKYTGGVATIVTEKHQEVVCQVDVHPCGCVKDTDLNQQLIQQHCGCSLVSCHSKIFNQQDMHGLEQYKYSPCGTQIYIIGARATEYMVVGQRVSASADSLIPHYCLDAVLLGIASRATMLNPTKNRLDKAEAKQNYKDAKREVIEFLNPISLEAVTRLSVENKPW